MSDSLGNLITGIVFNGIEYRISKTVGQPDTVACPNSSVRGHIAFTRVHPVGYRASAEAPFVPDDFGHNAVVCARPDSAQAVHTRHKSVAAAFLNHNFKRFKVNFAKRLLGKESEQSFAIVLRIVYDEMFYVRINTHILRAGHGSRADFPRKNAVLGIIFAVSSAERIAVRIRAGRVPAVQTVDGIFFSAHASS